MSSTPPSEFRDHCRMVADAEIRLGFNTRDEVIEAVADMMADEYDFDDVDSAVEAVVVDAFTEHLRDQLQWPSLTDCDRLDRALDALQDNGVVARQHFWCCQTCAGAAIWDDIAAAQAQGKKIRGYVFYHVQDTEGAVERDGLYLSYGATAEGDERRHVTIGWEIVAHLEREGLACEWDGSVSRRIAVKLDWKRRRDPEGNPVLPRTADHDG